MGYPVSSGILDCLGSPAALLSLSASLVSFAFAGGSSPSCGTLLSSPNCSFTFLTSLGASAESSLIPGTTAKAGLLLLVSMFYDIELAF